MSETPKPKNREFLTSSEPHVDSTNFRLVDEKNGNYTIFSPTSEEVVKIRYTAHALKWSWKITGSTARKPIRTIHMRNWDKRFYAWKGAKIVLNQQTLEIFLRSRYYNPSRRASSVMRLIGANWSKADRIAREFSEYAQIAMRPIQSDHPFDIQHAHLVMTTKELNPILKPMSKVKDKVGLIFDKSHPGQPEFTGEKSVEGARGAEWFFTKFPDIVQHQIEMDDRFAKNLERHLAVLEKMDQRLDDLGRAFKKKK